MTKYIIVSYGAGTNSAAMLVGLHEINVRPDAITFSNTGDEKPHTYEHIDVMNKWCAQVGFPQIETLGPVMPQQIKDTTLEIECLRLGKLPAKAYGFSSCSDKWKIEPARRFNRKFAEEHGADLSQITRYIGFDADEEVRVVRGLAAAASRGGVKEAYPLFDWGWSREECIEAITRAGIPQPGKSACFYCPSSKKHEIMELARLYPDLARRAIFMERRALAGVGPAPQTTSAGLGRGFSWEGVLAGKVDMTEVGMPDADCGCVG